MGIPKFFFADAASTRFHMDNFARDILIYALKHQIFKIIAAPESIRSLFIKSLSSVK